MNLTRLNLGCGFKKTEGWINIDNMPGCNADIVHDLLDPLPFPDQSVDEILAEDVLEHFNKYERYFVFYDWARVLKVGGKITLQVPNFKKIAYRYFKLRFDNFLDLVFGENLLGSKVYIGNNGNHKWGYSGKSLSKFAEEFGIASLGTKDECLNIRFFGKKSRHVSREEADSLRISSSANRSEKNRGVISLKEASELIKAKRV
ncbi:MAG: methyltransferase domain-containing protein [Candidatus Omnitrophica bacterium]|nr:methyltransferase domain-containing protein [Candidatus Omnitrophota bacterium]